jgi:hypothetical protein
MEKSAKRVALCSVPFTKCYSGNEIKENGLGGACDRHGGRRSAYRILIKIPEGKRTIGQPERR